MPIFLPAAQSMLGKSNGREKIVIFPKRSRPRRQFKGFSFEWEWNPWAVDLDARLFAEMMRNGLAGNVWINVLAGEDPSTGRRTPRKQEGGGRWLIDSGYYHDRLRGSKVTGSEVKARARIYGPRGKRGKARANGYGGMLQREWNKGRRYLTTGGRHTIILQKTVDETLEQVMAGKTRSPNVRARRARDIVRSG